MKKLQPLLILSLALSLTAVACLQPQRGVPPKQPTAANKPTATATPNRPPVGSMTRAKDISRYLKIHQGRFLACFERAKKDNPNLSGTVELEGVLHPDGSIKAVLIKKGTLQDAKARTCLIGELSGITVPEAKAEMPTRVVFPLQFGM